MSWSEFCGLLGGLMHDTPLGGVLSIRSEKDPKVIKNFSLEQKKIRSDWVKKRNKRLRSDPDTYNDYIKNMQNFFAQNFGKGGN